MASLIQNRSLIKIEGSDSFSFAQNLITNDIHSSNYLYAMMLSPGGRFLFDMFILKQGENLLLDVFKGTKDILLDKLDLYNISHDVSISELKSKIYYSRKEIEDSYKDPRFDKLGYRFFSKADIQDDNSYIEDKYKYSIPDGGLDLFYDKAMPQEYGAEEINAISYNKGCYIGQEVISRTKHIGEVRKKIYHVSSDHDLSNIEHGTNIIQNDKKVGIFCSGYGKYAISLIREMNLDGFEAQIGEIYITLKKAIFY